MAKKFKFCFWIFFDFELYGREFFTDIGKKFPTILYSNQIELFNHQKIFTS